MPILLFKVDQHGPLKIIARNFGIVAFCISDSFLTLEIDYVVELCIGCCNVFKFLSLELFTKRKKIVWFYTLLYPNSTYYRY